MTIVLPDRPLFPVPPHTISALDEDGVRSIIVASSLQPSAVQVTSLAPLSDGLQEKNASLSQLKSIMHSVHSQ